MPYYAVRVGRVPGIYSTWPECQAQVNGFSGCAHAKFSTRQAAEEFVRGSEPSPPREVTIPSLLESKQPYTECYTDGSFAQERAGGAAVIVSTGQAYLAPVEGLQTNNRGELTGIMVALQVTQGAVRIHTDSEWCIRVLTGVYRPTKNLDLIAKVQEHSRGRKVEYVKVLAHSGIRYNELADQLADQARSVSELTCVKVE